MLAQQPDVLRGQRVARWDTLELESSRQLPSFFDEIASAAGRTWSEGDARQRRLRTAIASAQDALTTYEAWLSSTIDPEGDAFALGSEPYDELVALRAFDGLTTDDILEIGEEQLAEQQAAGVAAAAEIDPTRPNPRCWPGSRQTTRRRSRRRSTEYREAMFRARDHLVEHDMVTIRRRRAPQVIATPEYLRNVMPFAAYFAAAAVRPVTATGDLHRHPVRRRRPGARCASTTARSIYNTSIHEAYPGPPPAADRGRSTHPSLIAAHGRRARVRRGLGDVQRADDARGGLRRRARPLRHDATPTPSGGRAGSSSTSGSIAARSASTTPSTSWSSRPASSDPTPRPRSTATRTTPTYQLSYLLGKVMLLRLRDDEQRRLGDGVLAASASTTRCCTPAACRSASTAGCWPARAAADLAAARSLSRT